jgi:hypothetical protein
MPSASASSPSPYLARPAQSFRGIGPGLQALLRESGLAAVPAADYVVYGSALRALWTSEAWADLNVAFTTAGARDRHTPELVRRSRRVSCSPRVPPHPDALLDEADFTVCQLLYHDGACRFSPVFFEHLAQRLLVVNRVTPATAVHSWLRTYKMVGRGYALPYSELGRILDLLEPGKVRLDRIDVLHETGGAVLPG